MQYLLSYARYKFYDRQTNIYVIHTYKQTDATDQHTDQKPKFWSVKRQIRQSGEDV